MQSTGCAYRGVYPALLYSAHTWYRGVANAVGHKYTVLVNRVGVSSAVGTNTC